MSSPSRSLRTADGTNHGAFHTLDWSLLLFNTFVWGSSYLFIAISLEGFTPGMIALLRTALGAAVLSVIPAARRRIDRSDWVPLVIICIAGNAGPAILFPLAQRSIESSLAGMLTASVPLFSALIAVLLGIRSLRRTHLFGLVFGFVGVVLLGLPGLTGEGSEAIGVIFVLIASIGYALNGNVQVPLVQKYGALPVVMWAQLIGVVLLLPVGARNLSDNAPTIGPILAMLSLGLLSTGASRYVQGVLIGRVGAPRASVVGYLLPIVALILGVTFRGEEILGLELAGLALILVSAAMVTRAVRVTRAAPLG